MSRRFKWHIKCPECQAGGRPRAFVDWSYFQRHLGGSHAYVVREPVLETIPHTSARPPDVRPATIEVSTIAPWFADWAGAFFRLNPELDTAAARLTFRRNAGRYWRRVPPEISRAGGRAAR